MEFLDPAKQTRHRIILWVGYVLVAVGIVIATLVLLYQAYGFGLGKNGTVIQNGLVFLSSQPRPANIYMNGKLEYSPDKCPDSHALGHLPPKATARWLP